ncbi:MarR family winged helix-turn-helix transcriptional regulator [Virgibacillus halophilus]|uniref:MarR family winged helix-turn-helix transcriptional regulator n=1 Tax=Tigheibacillus halophilus TaxID=361280 RepID=A0ABU5C768_9BACI|nr:MarR family winged helix-turn-helix transcriptional regulator [Virgibacillus halophilus]
MEDKDTRVANMILDVIRTANLLERLGAQYAKEADLSSVQQYMILSMLSNEGDLPMRDLRQNTLVTKQAVTGLVERLSQTGYVETCKDTKDHRVTLVRLTSAGEKALEIIRPFRVLGNRNAFSVLSDEEFSQLSAILPKLIHHLKSNQEHIEHSRQNNIKKSK